MENPISQNSRKHRWKPTLPNKLYSEKRYEDAIEAYRKRLGTEKGEDAFSQIILCYLALWNANGDENGKYLCRFGKFCRGISGRFLQADKNLGSPSAILHESAELFTVHQRFEYFDRILWSG